VAFQNVWQEAVESPQTPAHTRSHMPRLSQIVDPIQCAKQGTLVSIAFSLVTHSVLCPARVLSVLVSSSAEH
jgi:hypothetical protein